MALYHKATITPSKADLIASWAPSQSWYPSDEGRAGEPEVVGAFRFDDPTGQTGIETHLVAVGDAVVQVPLTYRNEPLAGAEDSLIGPMEHSALGTRHVYDGVGDPIYLAMLAGAAMTGQGEALGMVEYDGRWHIAPTNVRLVGGGWGMDRIAVDEFETVSEDEVSTVMRNDGFELTFFRRLAVAERPPMGLTAQWPGRTAPMLLAQVSARAD